MLVLSGAEARPGAGRPNDPPSGRFAALDRNGNGVISWDEWRASRDEFDRLDRNDDRVLTRDEFARR